LASTRCVESVLQLPNAPPRQEDWRRIATRYDRTARNFLSAVALAATFGFWAK
jgi:hypothetical protein